MNNPKQEPSAATGCGCLIALMYLLYWPALWGMRAGAEFHASRHPGFAVSWGEPEFWALMWFAAPVTTPFLLLGNLAYWVLGPMMEVIVGVFW